MVVPHYLPSVHLSAFSHCLICSGDKNSLSQPTKPLHVRPGGYLTCHCDRLLKVVTLCWEHVWISRAGFRRREIPLNPELSLPSIANTYSHTCPPDQPPPNYFLAIELRQKKVEVHNSIWGMAYFRHFTEEQLFWQRDWTF